MISNHALKIVSALSHENYCLKFTNIEPNYRYFLELEMPPYKGQFMFVHKYDN